MNDEEPHTLQLRNFARVKSCRALSRLPAAPGCDRSRRLPPIISRRSHLAHPAQPSSSARSIWGRRRFCRAGATLHRGLGMILDILTVLFFVLGFALLFWMFGERPRYVL